MYSLSMPNTNTVTIGPVTISIHAAEVLEAAGINAAAAAQDVTDVRTGARTRAMLLEACLDGAEASDVVHGWEEYVDEVVAAAELNNITDDQVAELGDESRVSGDLEQVAICDAALAGDEVARAECARVIRAAQAMG